MRWAEAQRLTWIRNRLHQRRKINRKDIMEKFGISMPQASLDLKKIQALYPNMLEYDRKAKCYRLKK